MTRIVTHHEFPPIPDRRFDWCAHSDNYDGAPDSGWQPVGWGRTEADGRRLFADLRGQRT